MIERIRSVYETDGAMGVAQKASRFAITSLVDRALPAISFAANNISDPLAQYYLRMLPSSIRRPEGHMSPEEAQWYRNYLNSLGSRPLHVLEIGFNLGHSACAALSAKNVESVTSVELGVNGELDDDASKGESNIYRMYGDRHRLVLGNSVEALAPDSEVLGSVPPFDVALIDGGHDYDVASADIANVAHWASQNSASSVTVIVDDYCPDKPWGIGPYEAWRDAVDTGAVVDTAEQVFTGGRAVAYGKVAI